MDLAGMLEHIHRMVWGPWTLAVCLGVGIYFSIRFGFFPVRGFCFWWSATAGSLFKEENNEADTRQGGRRDSEGERAGAVSQLQSVCTALAATVGTGNIAGVATALAAGGPGVGHGVPTCSASRVCHGVGRDKASFGWSGETSHSGESESISVSKL